MGQVLRHPTHGRPYERQKATRHDHSRPYPEGVVPLFPAAAPREKSMPERTPELCILTAILMADPKLARQVNASLFFAKDGSRGESAEAAANYLDLIVGRMN